MVDNRKYIKVYIKQWTNNPVPAKLWPFYMDLATNMTTANTIDCSMSQLLYIDKIKDEVKECSGIENDDIFFEKLDKLVKCNAIRMISPYKCYQVNPHYIANGDWIGKNGLVGISDLTIYYDQQVANCKSAYKVMNTIHDIRE